MLLLLETDRYLVEDVVQTNLKGERGSLGRSRAPSLALRFVDGVHLFWSSTSFQREKIVDRRRSNTIETAYLGLHSLLPQARLKIQELFRHYVDSRLETYRRLPDMQA